MYHGARLIFNQIPKYLKMENTGVTANSIALEEVRKKKKNPNEDINFT